MALTQINRPDSQKALFGTGSDLEIYHDGSHSYIDHSGTGSLFIKGDAATTLQTDTFTVKNYGGSETFLVGTGNGAIELYYNNEKTLQTTASGAEVFNQDGNAVLSIIGNEGNAAQLYLKSDDGDDNADVWRMHADASGNLLIENYASGSYESNIKCVGNGVVELYHDNEKVFETYQHGVLIQNTNGNGEITLRGSEGNGAQFYFQADDGDDNEDKWRIDLSASDGALGIQNYGDGAWEKAIEFNHGGAVELYYDNSKKLETQSLGVNITGNLDLADDGKVRCGAASDLEIFHNGSHNYIDGVNGRVYIRGDGRTQLQVGDGSTFENSVVCYADGRVDLYYDSSIKLATTSTGTTVTGYQLQTAVPAFRAGRQASALSVDAGDAIIFDVTNMGGGFNQGSHYNTSTGRFTAPVAGVYHFHACVIYQDLGTGGTVDMEDVFKVYVNSTQISFAERRAKYTVDGTGSSGYYTDHFSLTTSLSANDYIWLRQDKDSRVIHNNNTYSHFSGHLVG